MTLLLLAGRLGRLMLVMLAGAAGLPIQAGKFGRLMLVRRAGAKALPMQTGMFERLMLVMFVGRIVMEWHYQIYSLGSHLFANYTSAARIFDAFANT